MSQPAFANVSQSPATGVGPIVYRPTQVSSAIPLVFVGVGLLFAAVGLLFTIIFVFVFAPIALVTLLLVLFGVGFAAFGGWRWYSNKQQRLELNSQALLSFSKNGRFQLPLAEISFISIREGFYRAQDPLSSIDLATQHRYLMVRIESNSGAYLDLDVSQGGYVGLYDVARVLRDLIPRLPATVQIDPRVHEYVTAGRIT